MSTAPTASSRPLRSRQDVRALLRVRRDLLVVPASTAPPGAEDEVLRDDGVVVRSLRLEVPDGDPVPCLYLTPDAASAHGTARWPGVVAIHQHNGEFDLGKSEPAGLAGNPAVAYGAAVARLGAAVIVPDLQGFEDRGAQGGDRGEQGGDGRRAELLEAFGLLVRGTTLQARHVEDVALCVSWLMQQTGVTGPVGLIGHSLGGQVAFFAAACDERVGAAVLSCGLGTVESFHHAGVLHNPAWYVPDLQAVGDTPAVAAVTTGQSFWVSAGEDDPLFPVDGVRRAVAGFPPGAAHLRRFAGGHELPPEVADEAYAWLVDTLRRQSGRTAVDA